MSYILEALKKADAERHLGNLPGIHSTSVAQGPSPDSPGWRHWKPAAAFLLSLALLALGVAAFKQRSSPLTPAGTVGPTPASHALALPPVLRDPVSGPGPAAPGISSGTEAMPAVSVIQGKPVGASGSLPATLATDIPLPPALPKRLAGPRHEPAKKTPPATDRQAPPVLQDVVTLAQLPAGVQQELPPLTISGTMYSATPADRLLLIDKRMLHEGDEIAPGVILEGVLPKGARLRYKGYVFQVSY